MVESTVARLPFFHSHTLPHRLHIPLRDEKKIIEVALHVHYVFV